MSNLRLRRDMVGQHPDQFERHARRAEAQHIPDLQHDVTPDPLVVDERAVRAVVRDERLAVALLQRAVLKRCGDREIAGMIKESGR